jgi:PKD repeat protein
LPNSQVEDRLTVAVNAPPEPMLFSAATVTCADEEVAFDASSSTDPDGTIAEYAWDFGDGNQAKGVKTTHRYQSPGAYGVTLRVTDNSSVANDSGEVQQTVRVNNPPVADGGPARDACIGELMRFDAGRSTDTDGKLVAYQWDFGDGNQTEGVRASHRYETGGLMTARLTVTDDSESACATASQTIPVHVNRSPKAQIALDAEQVYSGGAHDEVLFSAEGSTDADADSLRYFWDFGDRTKGEGAKIWHRFKRPGKYLVKLRVVDDSGTSCGEGRAEMLVTVKGR